jgi:AhpD family alkylhydroperoxidase
MPAASTDLQELRDQAAALMRAIPETMRGFQATMKASSVDGSLSTKVKELISLAVGITSHCEGCIVFHVENAIRHGATRIEVAEAIGVAIAMGGGPATVFGGKALAAFDRATQSAKPQP